MYKISWPYALLSGYYVGNCLRLLVVVIYCYHGDSSDGRHVCTGHTHYYQAITLVIVINSLRLLMLLSFCCCHGDGSDGWHVWLYPLLSGYYVGKSD